MDDLQSIARLIDALRPWLGELVIVGGWAHRLHRFFPSAQLPTYQPLRTRDADIAFSPTARLAGDIGAALVEAGFREELSGDHTPPVTWYRLGDGDQGFYAEFLAPLMGSGTRRDGASDATLTRAGVTAQKLRYVKLLLTDPCAIRLDATSGVSVAAPVDVQLPNPVSFVAQKLLIQARRPSMKQAQDALSTQIERLARDQHAVVTDVHRTAVHIPQDRTLAPERLRASCAYGLAAIFGT